MADINRIFSGKNRKDWVYGTWNPKGFDELRRAYSELWSDLASAVGVSEQSVRNWAKPHAAEKANMGPRASHVGALVRLFAEHFKKTPNEVLNVLIPPED